MAHEIEVVNGKAKMFYAGETPWHGLGISVKEALTSAEAIVTAGLDWEVKVGRLHGPTRKVIGDRFSIYRVTDDKVLGFCSSRYHPWQNREAFDFLDSLVQDGVMHYETAGSLFGGCRVWMLARLEEDMRINDEEYHSYMLLTTSHDLGSPVMITPTMKRVICDNTLQWALGASSNIIRIKHTASMTAKLEQAKSVLRVTTESSRKLAAWLERAQEYTTESHDVERIQEELLGPLDDETTPQRKRTIELFQSIYQAEESVNGPTAYSLVNAITGFADHGMNYRGNDTKKAESRFMAVTEWNAKTMKDKGFQLVAELMPS